VSIWGWADKGDEVTVTFDGKEEVATAGSNRSWKVTFPAMSAGAEPRTLVVKGREKTLTLENILVGDVWVLGGQSNMEFPLTRIENGQLEIVSANYPNIRILTIPAQNGNENRKGFPRLHEWSGWFGRHFRKGDWDACSPDTVRELSAIGYVFARRIHMAARVPIGVIDVSRGGTTVETWTPDPMLRTMETEQVKALLAEWDKKVEEYDPRRDLEERVKRHHDWVARMKKEGKAIPADRKAPTDLRPGPAMNQNRPGNCYASMIAPIAGLQVKGAIFHQGYNNCFSGTQGAIMYAQVFPKMITAWRAAFDNPEMPFGIISLCTQGAPQTRDNYVSHMADVGPYIREAQYKTFLHFYSAGDKNIGFTSTYDLRRRWYHPQLKIPAGERIARWALATQYGFDKQIRWKPPMAKAMKVEDGRILLTMDESTAAVDDGGPMEGFAIAGRDRKFHPADIAHLVTGKDGRGRPRKDMKVLVLSSPMVPAPVHYRYAWARSPMANMQAHHNTDIPMATQRSDDWPLEDVPLGVLGDDPPAKLDRSQRRQLVEALRKQDLERRLREAEALIQEHRGK
jgi:sialate O-acetylesterase